MSSGQGGNGADPTNGTGGQPGADNVANGIGAAGGNGGSSAQGSGGGAGGAAGTTGGAGGNGGAAAGGTVTNTSGTGGAAGGGGGAQTGGTGGTGRAGPNPGDGGGGGGGGAAGQYFVLNNSGSFSVTRTGGNGGDGGAGSGTGGGGGGGAGGYGFIEPGSASFSTSGLNTGGSGGNGGAAGGPGAVGGAGGNGGIGLFLNGSTSTNSGTITGGNGGLGGAANGGTAGAAGQGGAGIAGANLTITNTGTISGGFNGGSTTVRGDAITFTGGNNTLTPSTGTLNGGLGVTGSLSVNGANVTVGNVIHDHSAGAGSLVKSDGGILTLTGANTYTGTTTIAANNTIALSGAGSIASSSAVANNGTFDISGTTAGAAITTLSGTGGTTLGAQTLTITNGSTTFSGAIGGTGGVAVAGGTQTLTGASNYSGGTTIGATGSTTSSTLQLGASTSAGTGAITFASLSGTATAQLGLNVAAQPANGGTFGNTLANFNTNSQLNLAGLTNSSVSYNSANSSITVTGTRTGGGQVSENFVLSAPRATNFVATADGNGGTRITATNSTPATPPAAAPCYVTGTRIRVLRGRTIADVPVERLEAGDLPLTASGKPRPIRWIGTRSYPGLTAPKAERPVRIRAGALAEGMPARDLLISPDHCLWLDGLFVAAGHLVNGTSITRGEAVRDLTYWHVELDSHDLLLAEATPAESFLAAPGVRAGFDGMQALDAGVTTMPYAPRTELGPELAALRRRLILRAAPLRFSTVRAWLDRCDGTRVAGWAQDTAQPEAPVCLDIVVDGEIVAMPVAAEYRADIAAAGVGSGRHGFDLGLAAPLTPGKPHVVEVLHSADGLRICAMQADAAGVWTAVLAA